jgi:hypothetical protein
LVAAGNTCRGGGHKLDFETGTFPKKKGHRPLDTRKYFAKAADSGNHEFQAKSSLPGLSSGHASDFLAPFVSTYPALDLRFG